MKYTLVLIMLVGVVLTAGLSGAQNANPYGVRNTVSDRTAAAAALLPVDGISDSWGRVMVADRTTAEGTSRDLVCHLYALDMEAEYRLLIDGFDVAGIATDAEGEGWLHLQTPAHNYPEVPADLPPVADLAAAQIVDVSGIVILEGALEDLPSPPAGAVAMVYVERTRLEDPTGGPARGQARVGRDVDDVQYFTTTAIGLEAGAVYRIEVDGNLAGVVTAEGGGFAELQLSTGDFGDALPAAMQPVEDLRLVQWISQDGDVLALEGAFTGVNQVGLGGPNGGGDGHHGDDQGDGGGNSDGRNGGNDHGGTGPGDGTGDGSGGNGDGDCDGSGRP